MHSTPEYGSIQVNAKAGRRGVSLCDDVRFNAHISDLDSDKYFSLLQEKLLIGGKEMRSTVQLTYDAFSLVSF